jgi:peptide/nickel transport system substrate-binding protein
MRRRAFAWLALSSLAATFHPLPAATRPRYGGTLTLQLAVSFPLLDPSDALPDPVVECKRDAIARLAFENLVSISSSGDIEPQLATAWTANRKRWRFTLRPKALFHDGTPVNAASVIPSLQAALKKRYADVAVGGAGQILTVQSENNLDNLVAELSLARNAIFRRSGNGEFIGTGPFRLEKWEPGRRAVFTAFEDHWAGRPYVDTVVVNFGPLPRQLTTTGADIWDFPFSGAHRIVPDAIRLWSSAPSELVAIFAPNLAAEVLQALALSIDRSSIVNVLAQRRGETAGGLLPQWLTGYAFLFATAPDPARAKELLASTKPGPLTLSYPADDAFARSVADRVSLNARDAGLTVQPITAAAGSLRLIRIPLPSADAALDLAEIASVLGVSPPNLPDAAHAETLYQAERLLLNEHKIIPLIYLPAIYGIGPRVHDWDASQNGRPLVLHLENVWLSP